MTWNYRIMRHVYEDETAYIIHEVYYDETGAVSGWTEEGVAAISDNLMGIGGMQATLTQMELALSEAVLDAETGKPVEIASEPPTN